MSDLFKDTPGRYPTAPGFKEGETSRAAAEKMTGRAAQIRRLVAALYADHYPAGFTADEVAGKLKISILSVRPRVSELSGRGMVEKTGVTRKNESGHSAHVWRASDKLRRAAA